LIHPGAGRKIRYIQVSQAKQILDDLCQKSAVDFVLFIGFGKDEEEHIEKIIKKYPKCVNLSNKLNVLDVIFLCKNAKLVISTDSAISHIASAFDNPQLVLFKTDFVPHLNLWCLKKPNIQIGRI
jgi:ADP-heptose:LPS heptosyltransferase